MQSLLQDIPSGQTDIAETLVKEINDLLNMLSLPISINTPYDLTPSLLLAILESILQDRLPISAAVRESSTPTAKVEAMKVFLGVLEDDVFQIDIGLSEIDPRKLAAGDWDELVFVGQALCWLAQTRLDAEKYGANKRADNSSASTSHCETNLDIGPSRLVYDASETNATTLPVLDPEPTGNSQSSTNQTPICIHEIDFSGLSLGSLNDPPEEDVSEDMCECLKPIVDRELRDISVSSPKMGRRSSIHQTNHDIEAYEARRHQVRVSKGKEVPQEKNATTPIFQNTTRHISPSQHTAALLLERARLLEELAALTIANRSSQ